MARTAPPPVQRFRIHFDVLPEALGPTLVTLESLGIQDVHYEVITEVARFTKNQPWQAGADNAPAGRAPLKHPRGWLKAKILEIVLKAEGRPVKVEEIIAEIGPSSSAYGTLTALVE